MPSAIPTIVDPEIAVDLECKETPKFIWQGVKAGAIVALQLAFGYALFLAVGVPLWDIIESGWTSYTSSSFALSVPIFGMAAVFGSIPALIIGAIGGAIVGVLFRQLSQQVTLSTALTLGMAGGALLLAPLTISVAFLLFRDDILQGNPVPFGMIWGFPALIALLGFARVGQRLNLLLPDTFTHV